MLRLEEKQDEIIIRDVPVGRWIWSLAATVLIALFLYISFLRVDLRWQRALFIAALGLLAFYICLITPVTTTKINRETKLVSVRKQSLLGYSFKLYSFDEIAEIYVAVDDVKGFITHQIMMPLKNKEKIELSIAKPYLELSTAPTPTAKDPKGNSYFSMAKLLNQYVLDSSKQIPSKSGNADDKI
jgi:hypothetical protein